MNCEICNGTETVILDGVEYCAECNKQIKGSQSEDCGDDSFSKSILISSPKVKKETKEDVLQAYQPWISTEAYNLILAKQVSELINLGCSEKLKDVVLHIWAQYLQKCEVAFCKNFDDEENIPHLSDFALKRDTQLLYGDGKLKRQRKKFKKSLVTKEGDTLKKSKKKLTEQHETAESKESSSVDEGSIICSSEDSSLGIDTDEQESSDNSSQKVVDLKKNIKLSAAAQKNKSKKMTHQKNMDYVIHHMNLAKTLSFCHLGLLYTEDQLLLFDFIRLIQEGDVPYIDVTRHFPSSMQLQDNDHSSFTKYTTPELKRICQVSSKLMHFLQLPKFKQPSLLPIATRFVKDLNLPNDLIPALKIVIDDLAKKGKQFYSVTEKGYKNPIPVYETQAMAVIIIVLKMLLVLDGEFEVEHDEVMAKLNAVVEDYKFFIWDEWKQQAQLKEYLFLRDGFNYSEMNCLDSLCTDRIIGRHPYCCSKPDQSSILSKESKRQHAAQNTLKLALEEITTLNPLKGKPTSFPLRLELHRLTTEWERYPIYKNTSNIDFSFINRDFSNDKFCYKQFEGSTDPEDFINILFSSLYESVQLKHTFPRGSYFSNILRTSKKYWHVNILHRTLVVDRKRKWLKEFPESFRWLLLFLSKYLQINCDELYLEVKCIEQKLFK